MTNQSQVLAPSRAINKDQTRALIATKPKALEVMAANLNVDPTKLMGTLKATVFKNATEEEMLALVVVANTYGLNPLLKEMYAFPAKGGGIVPVVSIDGWIKMVNRSCGFDGVEFEMIDHDDGALFACTCTLFLKDRSRPVKVTEYFDECFRKTEPWEKMPRRMLRHKSFIQAARVAFGFSGVHDEDEAIDISGEIIPDRGQITATASDETVTKAVKAAPETTRQANHLDEVEKFMKTNNISFDQLRDFLAREQWIVEPEAVGGLEDLGSETITRIFRAKVGILADIKAVTEGAK
jgi:phage recombination protein Bet